jgi:nucleoside-diphosphate-sugar epimerase
MSATMRVVVTGALGHIGSRLIRSLPEAFPEAEVIMIDDLSTQRFASLFDLSPRGRYRFHQADVTSADLGALFGEADVVVHLAAITNAEESFAIQEQVERVNLDGTERVARACMRSGAGLVFLSTTSVYGTQNGRVDEGCPAEELRPQSPYAASKLRAEQLLERLSAEGLRHVTLRCGTIAGPSPGMRFHTAVNKFCWQAVMGEPLTVWRSALHQRRPYLELADATSAIELVLRRGPDGQLYNVITVNATVAEIVALVREAVPDLQVHEVESRVMNQLSYEVDGSRFQSLGYAPTGDLRGAIRSTVALLRAANGTWRSRAGHVDAVGTAAPSRQE